MRVADIFVDDAAMRMDRLGHRRQIEVHDLDQALRRHAFAQRREPLHVAEHHGHDAALAFGRGERGLIEQTVGDPRIDIAAKGLADALVLAQPFDHAVEGGRELADLVAAW